MRDPNLGTRTGKGEACWHDADDFPRRPVQKKAPPQNIGIASEAAAPKLVAHDRDLRRSRVILLLAKRTAKERGYAEHFEQRRRHCRGVDANGLADFRQAYRKTTVRQTDFREGFREPAIDGIGRVGLFDLGYANPVAGMPEPVELLRPLERKRREEHRVHHAENGGIGADSEGKGQDRDRAETRAPQQFTPDEANLLADRYHGKSNGKTLPKVPAKGARSRPADPHATSRFFGNGKLAMLFVQLFERLKDIARELRGAPVAHVDEDRKVLVRGGEVVVHSMIHAQKVMRPLLVEIEELQRDADRVAEPELPLIGQMIFEREHRSRLAQKIILAETEKVEESIRRAVESHMVIGNVQVAVIVNPFRLDLSRPKLHHPRDSIRPQAVIKIEAQ